ncbi:hypothetical protein ACWEKT_35075 [Nocardia takedensis]|nr:hypothetical protein [Nocardia takedensis]
MKRLLIVLCTIIVIVSTWDYAHSDGYDGFIVLACVIGGFFLLRAAIG